MMTAIFADNIFKCFVVNENLCILIWISMKFVPMGSLDNIPTSIGSHKGLVPIRQPAIICTDDGLVYWCIYA